MPRGIKRALFGAPLNNSKNIPNSVIVAIIILIIVE